MDTEWSNIQFLISDTQTYKCKLDLTDQTLTIKLYKNMLLILTFNR